jgi:phosphohistidine phosphatase SixA
MKTKKIIFVRHAKALGKTETARQKVIDSDRVITAEGHKEFKKHIKKHKKSFKNVDLFVTSPYIRAVQTLDVIFDVLDFSMGEATIHKKITPDDNPKFLLAWLKEQKSKKIVIVGHESFMSRFMKLLFQENWNGEKISKGSFIEFEIPTKNAKYKIS